MGASKDELKRWAQEQDCVLYCSREEAGKSYENNMARHGQTRCPFCSWVSLETAFRERKSLFRDHLQDAHHGALSATVKPSRQGR